MRSCRELLLQSAALLSEHPEFETPSDVASPLTFFAIEKRFGRRRNRRGGGPDRRPEECDKEEQDSRVLQERVTDPHCKVQFRSEEEMLTSFLNRHEVRSREKHAGPRGKKRKKNSPSDKTHRGLLDLRLKPLFLTSTRHIPGLRIN
ncbi:MAG: hypothetical protein BJ554DRAFT_5774 [Olpidium bornovanus]|uniref:Uncharacterized protein n=1 Tax=Olpidium bornovanus TaxID=278681 RepID=A0A8H8DMT4_9FUNG|nr:MAG: hypothetical protein BJ554DRAFT_5774 [Olpidium bornovanus]